MAKKRKPIPITCTSTNCAAGLHCFRATTEMMRQNRTGVCRECGASLVDWTRVHQCDLSDVKYTFEALKYECVRHHFWHKPLTQRAINHARRKGKQQLREHVRNHLSKAVGPAAPFRDGYQTTMNDQTTSVVPYGQHATATCCRKCMEYWHGIPQGIELTAAQLEYCTELVCLYIEDRVPELTEAGEHIPPIRT